MTPADVERLELIVDRFERGLKKVTELAFHLNAQADDAMGLIAELQEERKKFAMINNAITRKLWEKAINEWVEEERTKQQRMTNPRATGGFRPGGIE